MHILDEHIRYANKLKIDEWELVSVDRNLITVRITDSAIAEVKQNNETSLGVRLVHKKRLSVSQTTELTNASRCIDDAFNKLSYSKERDFWRGFQCNSSSSTVEKTFDSKISSLSLSDAVDISQSMINAASHNKIDRITGSLNIVSENFYLANSAGLNLSDAATYVSGFLNTEYDDGTCRVSGMGQDCARMLPSFNPEQIGLDATQMCLDSINPIKCPDVTCSVVFEPYSVGELLSFVLSSAFDLKTFAEKRSCFSTKLNEKIATSDFSLMDMPHAPNGIGSKPFDDEGTPTKDRFLIEKGVLKNLYSNLFDSFKENAFTTGNAIRPANPMGRDSLPTPLSAPHNLSVLPGSSTKDDLIKDTKMGLLVGRLWYTYAVNPIRGDFSCTARSGIRIIKNGNIVNAGKQVRIIHNIADLLLNLSQIGNDCRNVIQWASRPSITPSLKAEGIRILPS